MAGDVHVHLFLWGGKYQRMFCCLFATQLDLHGAIQTADWNWLAGIISALFFQSAQRLLAAQCRRKRAEEGEESHGWEPGSLGQFGWHSAFLFFLVLNDAIVAIAKTFRCLVTDWLLGVHCAAHEGSYGVWFKMRRVNLRTWLGSWLDGLCAAVFPRRLKTSGPTPQWLGDPIMGLVRLDYFHCIYDPVHLTG